MFMSVYLATLQIPDFQPSEQQLKLGWKLCRKCEYVANFYCLLLAKGLVGKCLSVFWSRTVPIATIEIKYEDVWQKVPTASEHDAIVDQEMFVW